MVARRKVTLSEVAERAGVSPTTASYILNGRTVEMRISADAERRVREAAAELRYRPNRLARSLRSDTGRGTSRTVAVVSDHIAGGIFASRMLDGARAAARERDHLLIVGETGGEPDMATRVIDEMLDRQVDGIVFATLSTHVVTAPPSLLHAPAAVLLNCIDPASTLRSVVPDELGGGTAAGEVVAQAVAHLPAAEARVWLVGDDADGSAFAGHLRHDGLVRRLQASGISVTGLVSCPWAVGPAYDSVTAWLSLGNRAHVLVCLNDRIAFGAYQAIADAGLRIPHDVSVVSFDGSELATWLRPALTSVRIPYDEMGAVAVQALLDPAAVPADDDGQTRIAMPVVAGRSTLARAPRPRLAPSGGSPAASA